MRMSNLMRVAIVAAVAVAPLRAIEQRPLPPFQVASPDGTAVGSPQLSAEARWLLLYVAPDCRSCDKLLQSLKDWHTPQLAARTVIVVRADTATAAAYVARHLPEEAADVRWYADASLQAWQALALKGNPVLIGVERGEIKWTISGVLNDPRSLESVVRSWVQ